MPTDSLRDAAFCDVLNRELVCALGCTEPIAVAYAAALASQTLGCEPDHMDVACSGNIIKNVKSVTVPNSGGMHGIEAAAVLGAVGGDAKSALEVLESVNDEDRARVAELLADAGYCDVSLVEGVPNLYIKVTATAGGHTAVVEITDHHTNVTCHTLDGIPVCGKSAGECAACAERVVAERAADNADTPMSIDSIIDFIEDGDIECARAAVARQIELNGAISAEGLAHAWGAEVGRTLLGARADDVACRARARAAAGSDARMNGCALPVAIVCGSGNQGITCALPVMEYAEYLRCDHERLVRAVMLSDLIAVSRAILVRFRRFAVLFAPRAAPALRLPGCAVARASRLARRSRIRSVTWAASCATAPRRVVPPRFRLPSMRRFWDMTWPCRGVASVPARV